MAKASKKKSGKKRKSTIKSVKKSTTKKGGKVTKVIHESTKEIKVERALVDNFIALQKVMVNMSLKFDNLSTQISKLLELFDISAKALAKKEFETEKESNDTHKIMQRLDNIAQQAGLIGKGLALIHEVNTEKEIPPIEHEKMHPSITTSPKPSPKPLPSVQPAISPTSNPVPKPLPSAQTPQLPSMKKSTLESKMNQQPASQNSNEKKFP